MRVLIIIRIRIPLLQLFTNTYMKRSGLQERNSKVIDTSVNYNYGSSLALETKYDLETA